MKVSKYERFLKYCHADEQIGIIDFKNETLHNGNSLDVNVTIMEGL